MNKNLALLFVLAFFMSSCALNINKHHALFGERKYKWTVQDRTVRIFIDKEGLYYPDMYINDKELKRSNGSLRDWYHRNPSMLNAACKMYKVDSSGSDVDAIVERLNDAIIKATAETININMRHFSTLNVLVHGFRRKAYNTFPGFTPSSRKDYQKMAGALTIGTARDVLYLEVYWDGYYFSMAHNVKDKANAFHSYATPNAVNAGLGLRKLLTKIKKNKDINIVTHSLGAAVGVEALFNASGTLLPQAVAAENNISTPGVNNIKLCMIAPALGSEVFAKYNSRNPDSSTGKDNYHVSVVYNINDIALQKGSLKPTDSGNTSLGCDSADVAKMQGNIAPSEALAFNFSKNGKKKNKGHFVNSTYLKNAKFQEVAEYIGERKADEEIYAKVLAEKIKNLKGAEKRAYDAKMREQARKAQEAKRKADAIAREKARVEREKERKAAEKQRTKEREQAAAERRAAERERMKQREAESKQKAADRAQQVKEKEIARKAAEKEKAAERDRAAAEKRAAEKEREAAKKRAAAEKEAAKKAAEKEKAEARKQAEAEKRAAEKQKEAERKAAEKEKKEAEKASKKK